MLGDPRSHGLWERTAPPAPETHALEGEARADVAVVGAGYTGLSAALHLAEAGARVVVLESAEIGFGGSGRNVGLVNAGLWMMPDDVVAALGPGYGERILDLLGAAPARVFALIERHAIRCEATRAGTLHLAVDERGATELAERARQWQRRGAPVELLDATETARRTGSPAYRASLLDRRAGTVQPLAYARGLAAAAIRAGAAIHSASPVESCEPENGRWRLRTPVGSLRADWVIAATNAYTAAPWRAIRREIVRLPYFNIATRPLTDNLARSILPGREGAWDTREVLSSFRLDAGNRLVVGSVGALRGPGAAIHRAWAARALRAIFPQLGEIAFEAEWYGRIGMTADSVPRFHELAPRIVSFSGYNGRGIAPGTVFGALLADLALGRIERADLPLPATAPAPQPLRIPREAAHEIGAAFAHLSSRS